TSATLAMLVAALPTSTSRSIREAVAPRPSTTTRHWRQLASDRARTPLAEVRADQTVTLLAVTEQKRRRIDIALSEGFSTDLGELSLEEVRSRRDMAEEVERELSYYRRLLHGRMDLDRKSTRLNSSHVKSSYA